MSDITLTADEAIAKAPAETVAGTAADTGGAGPSAVSEEPYRARTRWIENVTFLGETGSGHSVVMAGNAGPNVGVRPMETFLLGLGGCTAVDIMWFLKGMGEKVTGCDIHIEGKRAQTHPHVFTDIHVRYLISGTALNDLKCRLAIKMSRDKFCSGSAMLGKTAKITHDLEIIEAA